MDVYYKGEDITLTMTLFENEKATTPITVSSYQIDIVLYSTGETSMIHASNAEKRNDDVIEIISMGENVIKLVVGRAQIETLTTGIVMIEIRLKHKITDLRKILKTEIFKLSDTKVKNL